MRLTNSSLAFILILSVGISIFGTVFSLLRLDQLLYTGDAASDTGQTNFTITTDIKITFTVNNTNFGTGSVNDTDAGGPVTENCTLNSEGRRDYACLGFNVVDQGFRIQNDGNSAVNLNITSNESETEFIGGTAGIAAFQWKVGENESGACTGTYGPLTYTDVTQSPASYAACDSTGFESGPNDVLNLEIQLVIPQDAYLGARQATLTALGYT